PAACRDPPARSCEAWPWASQQPGGGAVGARREGVDDSLLDDEDLLAGHWQVREDVVAESTGRPGAADPEHIVYRQRSGLRRAMEVDTLLGGVLGACDGEMALGTIISAVARILAVDPSAAAAQTLGPVRTALREGILERS
ncbi:MAG: transferase, partial [Acidipropionibacterium jensenii]|nr:transferase [Acidipropionibacterium jensenii]